MHEGARIAPPREDGTMKRLPAFACFAAAAAVLIYGALSFFSPPGFAVSDVFKRALPSSIGMGDRRANPDPRLVKFMPNAESVLGEAKLEPGGTYLARVVFTDRRYDASGFRASQAKGKARFLLGNKTTGLQVKTARTHGVSRDAEKLTVTVATFSVAKPDTYVFYAECEDTKEVADMATFEILRVNTTLVLALVAVCAVLAIALGVAGALLL